MRWDRRARNGVRVSGGWIGEFSERAPAAGRWRALHLEKLCGVVSRRLEEARFLQQKVNVTTWASARTVASGSATSGSAVSGSSFAVSAGSLASAQVVTSFGCDGVVGLRFLVFAGSAMAQQSIRFLDASVASATSATSRSFASAVGTRTLRAACEFQLRRS